MSESTIYIRAIAAKARLLLNEVRDREVREMLRALARIYEAEADQIQRNSKNEDWLKAHPNVTFHFTPTSASWLNQVEVWFSILQGQSLSGASFTTLKQLEQHIKAYINA